MPCIFSIKQEARIGVSEAPGGWKRELTRELLKDYPAVDGSQQRSSPLLPSPDMAKFLLEDAGPG